MERTYYGRLSRFVVDLYPTICRDCLKKQLAPSQCQKAADKIRTLRPVQLTVTRNVGIRGDYGECDMPLMYILASCGCGSLPSTSAGWGKSPITGTGIADDIERMMSVYRKVVDSLQEEALFADYYNQCTEMTRNICIRLDTINAVYVDKSITTTYEEKFNALQKQSMTQAKYKSYAKQIKEFQQKDDEITNEKENFFRLSRIVGDLYTTVYHDVLIVQLPPHTCPTHRNIGTNVNKEERTVLNDVRNDNSYRKCDISLMYKLFRNACPSLRPPTAGWDKPVPPLAIGVSDDIERIRQTRNKAFGHISSTPVSEAEYKQYVQTATDICTRMDSTHIGHLQKSVSGTYLKELNNILTENLDTEMHRFYVDALTKSAKKEEDILRIITETGLECQKSIYRAEVNIVQKIAEKEAETQIELKTLGKKITGIATAYRVDIETRSKAEKEMKGKQATISKTEEKKHRKMNKNEIQDKKLSDVQKALETIHRKTLQHFPLNPLQKSTRIPFEMFNAPLKIREDLEFKRKTHKTTKKMEYKEIIDPSDLFEVDGRPAENIYLLGEAGRGKTGQCYQLVQHWMEAREAQKGSKKLSNWQKSLLVFDILCFVSLRHVDTRMHSVVEMICHSVMKRFPQYHETIRQILTNGLNAYECLIVIDGLDEKKGEVEIDVDMSRCTVLMTSRHWKFHELAPDINDRDRVVEVCGLDYNGREQVIEKILVNYFRFEHKSTELTTKEKEIAEATRDEKYKDIMDIPLLLTAFVYLWQSNTSFQESFTSFYVALLNLLIKLAYDNKRVTQIHVKEQSIKNVKIPIILGTHRQLRDHFKILLSLGKVAFHDVVLGNQQIDIQEKEKYKSRKRVGTLQLVFEKDELIEKLGPEVLIFALEVGLLSQSSAPGSFDDENVSINFFHKTIEEFLAALYLVCSGEVSFDSFRMSCTSIEGVMEFSNILVFSVGLQPKLGSVISEHIAQITDSEKGIIRYRQGFGIENEDNITYRIVLQGKVRRIFKTLYGCKQEMKYSLTQSKMKQISKFIISDVYVDRFADESTIAFSAEILSQDNGSIVSLHVEHGDLVNKSMLFQAVKEFLDNTSSLQTLHISKDEISHKLGSYREDMPTLCSIAPIFSSLTSLSLVNITLTSDAAGLLQKAIETNIKIQSLTLQRIYKEETTSHIGDLRRKTSLCRADNADVTELRLDMKANTRLRTLSLKQKKIRDVLDILLVDITQCRSIINLTLENVQVESVSMMHAAFSSFTQLKNLTLNHVSSSKDKKEQICLELTHCTGLTLDLRNIHLKGVEVSPVSLQNLTISDVSGSLRGLLSALRECQHLTYLHLKSLSDEHANLSWDLKACSRLSTLHLSQVHVGSFDIIPVSLNYLTLSNVSCSLRGLLLCLPECQRLTNIRIESLANDQDVKLLADVLPRLPQVRSMTYYGRRGRGTTNEGVVGYHSAASQAATRMTGLEYLNIQYIDMGDLVLTLTPLITHIKRVVLRGVRMTASSWGEFIASLLTIQYGFGVGLEDINIDDESVSTVHTSPHVNVLNDERGNKEGEYYCLCFYKLSS